MKKQKGNVLQVTLILLISLLFYISLVTQVVINNARNFNDIKSCDEVRVIENMFFASLKKQNADDILFSDEIKNDRYEIQYTVDDMGDYYLIESHIIYNRHEYMIELDLLKNENYFKRIEYK